MPEPFDETDAILTRKLAEITPPPGLRARLLALEPRPAAGRSWWARGISALAAALVALLAITSLRLGNNESLDAATQHFASFLSGGFNLVMETTSLPKIETWLASANSSMRMPGMFLRQTPIGCRTVEWRGHRGMLVCFTLSGGAEAHLVMFPSRDLSAPTSPRLANAGEWERAAWSRGGTTYLLFVPKGRMREILRIAAIQRAARNIASSRSSNSLFGAANAASGRPRISPPA